MRRFPFLLGVLLSATVVSQAQTNDVPQNGPNYVVNTLGDANDNVCGTNNCTLREAINAANGNADNSAITFDASIFAAKQSITFFGSVPTITSNLTITGPTAKGAGVTLQNTDREGLGSLTIEAGVVNIVNLSLLNSAIGLYNLGGTTKANNCTMSGNNYGIWNYNGLTLENCTVTGNPTYGIFNVDRTNFVSDATIISCTITQNGTGIWNGNETKVTLSNSIVVGNQQDIRNNTGTLDNLGFNIIGGTTAQAGLDPNSLQDNNGPTKTVALLPDSPAIDAGNSNLPFDQRGAIRPFDGNGDGTATNDIGAFEFIVDTPQNGPNYVVNQTEDSNDGACTTMHCTLREAINTANKDNVDSTITFDEGVFAAPRKTITLGGTQLPDILADGHLAITAPLAGVTISGNDQSRVFRTNPAADATLKGLTISHGKAADNGGGIWNQSQLTLIGCILRDNNARSGGGVYNYGSLLIDDCTLSNNSASDGGGGFFNFSGTTTINNSTFSDNESDTTGGGIDNLGTVALNHCTLNNNSAPNGGGMHSIALGVLTLDSSTLSNNRATMGAGILSTSMLTATNCTFSGNSASYSGGALDNSGNATIVSCTLSENSALFGGGILVAFPGASLRIGNTILKAGMQGQNLFNSDGRITSSGHNLSSDAAGGNTTTGPGGLLNASGDIRNTDPLLAPLADNGGPTQTHALLQGSPAINRGNGNLKTDQRGVTRPQGRTSDIGAYEAILLNVSIGDVAIEEGDNGTKNAVFSVSLATALNEPLSMNYETVNNASARPVNDFDNANLSDSDGATPRILTIPAGQTDGTITVPIVGDTVNEDTEVFYVLLSTPLHALFDKARATATITDNDAPPSLSINNVSVNEGNNGTRNANFTVRLSRPSGQVVSVGVASTNGSAASGSDYQPLPLTTIEFAPGQTQRTVTVGVLGDTLDENNENFFVQLSNAQNAQIGDAEGTGLILDDDNPAALSIGDASILEGNSGSKILTFTVSLLSASAKSVSVQFATSDGIARASSDYRACSGSLNFAPGQTRKTINVVINGDTQVESDETVYVLLGNPVNAFVTRGRGMGTIENDDASG